MATADGGELVMRTGIGFLRLVRGADGDRRRPMNTLNPPAASTQWRYGPPASRVSMVSGHGIASRFWTGTVWSIQCRAS